MATTADTIVPTTAPVTDPGDKAAFRLDIESLRAIAVVAVLLFHAGVPGFDGGFVGVDVFFVISGFLITGQMLRDADGPGLRFRTFYARRARRLLAAATLVIVATLVASALWVPPLQQAGVGADARSAALFYSNLRFAGDATDYFAQGGTPSPFQHFWSLSVEEQFYLVWPAVLLLAAAGATGFAARRRLALVLGVLVAASFAGSVWLTTVSQPWAFFSLPTRAWELALGALLAVGATRISRVDPRLRAVAGWLGLAAIVGSVVALSESASWPGYLAAIPVLGTTAVIAAGCGGHDGSRAGSLLSWSLSRRPLVVTGRYSYSLYLWHWPVLVIAIGVFSTVGTNWVKGLGVTLVVAVPAAIVSYHLVENPVRRWPILRPANAALAFGAVLIAGSVVASLLYAAVTIGGDLHAGRPAPVTGAAVGSGLAPTDYVPSDLDPSLRALGEGLGTTTTPECQPVNAGEPSLNCILGPGDQTPSIALFGDSHAAMWSGAFEEVAAREGIRFRRFAAGACGSILYRPLGGSTRNCDEWRSEAFRIIAEEQPELVVLVNQSYKGYARDAAEWEAGLRASIERLSPSSRVVVLGETPWSNEDVPDCLARNLDDVRPCEPSPTNNRLAEINAAEARIASETGAGFIDAKPWLCTEDRCPAISGNLLVYRDFDHLARPFVQSRADLLQAALDEQRAAGAGAG